VDPDGGAPGQLQVCVFKRASRSYAIPVKAVSQICFLPELTLVPAVAGYLKGAMNLRGEIVPVFTVDHALGVAGASFPRKHPIIVVQTQLGLVAIMVDKVLAVTSVPAIVGQGEVEGKDAAAYVSGIGSYSGDLVTFLNLERLVADLREGLERR
jgi:purine-binding chemotaxis protein CheW